MKYSSRFHEPNNVINYTNPNEKYIFEKKIGDGSASKIYICSEKETGERCVIKRIHKKEEWKSELYILKLIKENTKNLLEFKDFYFGERYVYIVTQFYEGFDLFEHIDVNVPLDEKYCKKLFKSMIECTKECHDLDIAHLDIKCENFMVKSMEEVKLILIDFGHAEKIKSNELTQGYSMYGTCFYLCPEGYDNYYSMKSDVWSLGVCLYLFITGDYPFHGDDEEYEDNVLNGRLIMDYFDNMSEEASELIIGCLEMDPRKRYSIEQILDSKFLSN